MKKVLILTASFGEGHNTAARNIRDAIESECPEASVELLDLFASSYGVLNTLVKKTFLQVVQHTPAIWSGIYNWLDHGAGSGHKLPGMGRLRQEMTRVVAEAQPDCVVSTYPAYAHIFAEAFRDHAEPPCPLVTVITDSISVNSVWFRAPSAAYCVANDLTSDVLQKAGIAADKIKILGFPVHPAFSESPGTTLTTPVGETKSKILYVVNHGKKRVRRTLESLLELPGSEITVTVGRDSELKAKLLKLTRDHADRVKVFGWTNQMPRLMQTHHFLVTKAGGATIQEAMAGRIPIIVNQVIPGQEEGNAKLIQELKIGAVAEKPDEAGMIISQALSQKAVLWKTWRENLQRNSRPGAASAIARFILEKCEDRPARPNGRTLFLENGRWNGEPKPVRPPLTRASRMLLCDFHIHSNYSDGLLTVPEIVDLYGASGFDCICITDHLADPRRLIGKLSRLSNLTLSLAQLDEYFDVIARERARAWKKFGMLVLTGIEFNKDGLTRKSSAHLLGVDLKAPIDPALDLPETIAEIHQQEGLAIASHPHIMQSEWGKNTLHLWRQQETYAPMIDAWEIANRNNIFTPIGLKSLPFIANSDFHKPKHLYSWKTLLHCEKNPSAIKQCIRQNRNIAITFYHKDQTEAPAPKGIFEATPDDDIIGVESLLAAR